MNHFLSFQLKDYFSVKLDMAKHIHTLAERVQIIEEVQKNPLEKKVDIAKRLGLPPSTLNTILSKKREIIDQARKCGISAKKRKTCKESIYSELESVLIAWYQEACALNLPVNGNLLREKALEIASEKGIEKFCASNGWISRFRERHGLVYKKYLEENIAVDTNAVEVWFQNLQQLLEGYEDCDIYQVHETGVFFNSFPDKSLTGHNFGGEKINKERLTVLLCTNKDGSDKRLPAVIGKFSEPEHFRNAQHLPVAYYVNKKSKVTDEIFAEFLHNFDTLVGEQRKILLFIDNCFAHSPDISLLRNIKVIFNPPNFASTTYSLDLGIIKSFNQLYKKEQQQSTVCLTEEKKGTYPNIYFLQAVNFIVSAWHQVTQTAIQNCFAKCSFTKRNDDRSHAPEILKGKADDNDIENGKLATSCTSTHTVNSKKCVSMEQNLMICNIPNEERVYVELESEGCEEKERNGDIFGQIKDSQPKPVPSLNQALDAFETVKTFIYSHKISEIDQKAVVNVENILFSLKK